MKTKFYLFTQNNSEGYFIRDNGLGVDANMFIEARSEDEAFIIYHSIEESYGEADFNEYCDCCGWRWDKEVSDIYDDIPDWKLSDRSSSIIMLSGKIIRIREDEKEESLMTYHDTDKLKTTCLI
ncbi:MAG: hypothetical protein Tp1102MES256162_32 [Prokaryotic dsDNA virus sp.]|jgi:hypothetical protein|nr:MAG: hypothetical protein Tp1102MES256162_32 [Prokaryotic dsDNA virus sp.]|tara:strand:+ start:454 stop:825 length:372 start_codon:yes stop_codon:yes gene_type:complete